MPSPTLHTQNGCVEELERHLAWLRGREERYQGNVEGIDIEYQLGQLQRLIMPKADYPRLPTVIDHGFGREQLGLIYRLLDNIEESIPWEGRRRGATIRYGKVWEKIHEHRESTGVYAVTRAERADQEPPITESQ